MKAKSLPAVDPSRLYTRQEVATMFALADIELFSYVSGPEKLEYENYQRVALSSLSWERAYPVLLQNL